ncbi:LCP family protein [Patescibacteria group bacterium]|nr:LCP family protein [Patescibacteria group bacterium]
MSDRRINLIDQVYTPPCPDRYRHQREEKRKKISRSLKISFFVFLIFVIFFSQAVVSQNSFLRHLGRLSFWRGVIKVATGQNGVLKGELSDRINILFLGMGGVEHEGPYLTDSIILVSIKPSRQQISLLSIPRDLYVPIPEYGWQKINFANALGMARSGDGGELASQTVSNVFSVPVHYWVRSDFKIFKEMVDELGGVKIDVEKSFTDYQFPGVNYQYRVVSFEAGPQIMDGETALRFVRSRHGDSGEGSDFARSKRQQKLLQAVANKVLDQNILAKPQKILRFYSVLDKNISSNLDIAQVIRLARLASYIPLENIITQTIENGEEGLLQEKILTNGAYVLTPKSGDFKDLKDLARDIFINSEPVSEQIIPFLDSAGAQDLSF